MPHNFTVMIIVELRSRMLSTTVSTCAECGRLSHDPGGSVPEIRVQYRTFDEIFPGRIVGKAGDKNRNRILEKFADRFRSPHVDHLGRFHENSLDEHIPARGRLRHTGSH